MFDARAYRVLAYPLRAKFRLLRQSELAHLQWSGHSAESSAVDRRQETASLRSSPPSPLTLYAAREVAVKCTLARVASLSSR